LTEFHETEYWWCTLKVVEQFNFDSYRSNINCTLGVIQIELNLVLKTELSYKEFSGNT